MARLSTEFDFDTRMPYKDKVCSLVIRQPLNVRFSVDMTRQELELLLSKTMLAIQELDVKGQ